ncbi:alpha/beta hydrolase [Aspergillus melleus]|uniref:alpha/beta hydrolase n=1 Tax=Aspergillus melleus TaxID=138277 RepID=UPI001E8DD3AA|nr:uncharacterized protein LDX57_002829 [Aspergillus melleus]KAH8425081.1 hypothetical protein LDX57_002829 [Aspergillus melleus]
MYRYLLQLVLLFSLATSKAFSAVNFPGNCDADCQTSFKTALAGEQAQWVRRNVSADPFYDSPKNLSAYAAGDVVRWEELPPAIVSKEWSLPPGTTLSRFLYMSEDLNGRPIPVSGFVLLPYANPAGDDGPLQTVAWAHGTAGGTRQCAPSNHRALYYSWEGPFTLVQQGYAVIAPDYAGQGSDIPQGFMYEAGALHAADISFAIVAARKVLRRRISHEWVVVGHSEGGLTAWRTNERQARSGTAVGGFLGAVSGAPALRPLSLIPRSFRLAGDGPVGDVVSIYVLQSIARLLPSIRVGDYVSDIVASRLPLADQGCLQTGSALYGNLTVAELYKNTSWLHHPDVVDWQTRYNGAGPHRLAAPMLVVQGLNDTLTYADLAEQDFDQTCRAFPDTAAQYLRYPGLDHDPAFIAAQAQYLPWIRDRFSHMAISSCRKSTIYTLTSSPT